MPPRNSRQVPFRGNIKKCPDVTQLDARMHNHFGIIFGLFRIIRAIKRALRYE
jgi:hypothetical protein